MPQCLDTVTYSILGVVLVLTDPAPDSKLMIETEMWESSTVDKLLLPVISDASTAKELK